MAVTSAQPHRRITVALEQSPYDVVIGDGSLVDLGRQLLDAGVRPGRGSWWSAMPMWPAPTAKSACRP